MTEPPSPTTNPLILLHGWGMHAALWHGCHACWPGAATYPLDLPGHGGQAFDETQDDIWQWATACLAAAPERGVWLGWSLGGLVALTAALLAPRRVSGLILLAATPRFVQAADWTPAMPESTLEQFHAGLIAEPGATLERFLALQLRGTVGGRETLRALRQTLAAQPFPRHAALDQGLDLLQETDLRGRLADIRCPALWLFGERDTLVPPAVAERVALLMPGARTLILEGAGHAPQLSHAAATAAAIRGFRDSCSNFGSNSGSTPGSNVGSGSNGDPARPASPLT